MYVGSFAHELLDLVALFGPLSEKGLIELYCRLKGFNSKRIRIVSKILEADMRKLKVIAASQVLAAMEATGMLGRIGDRPGSGLYYSKVSLKNYFMFKNTMDDDFRNARAQVLLSRRCRGRANETNLYRRFD